MSEFLLSQALAPSLKKQYHQGNINITLMFLLNKITLGPYRVMLKRDFDTACWIPPVGSRGSHSIYYGDRMLTRVVDYFVKCKSLPVPSAAEYAAKHSEKLKKSRSKGKKFDPIEAQILDIQRLTTRDDWDDLVSMLTKAVSAYGRHERAHATETPQNLKTVNKDLKLFGIPFVIFNWFEDARIENISRIQFTDKPFGWLELEDIAQLQAHPIALFARRIQLEGLPDSEAIDHPDHALASMAGRIAYYYGGAIKAPTGEHLYPLMKEFMTEFKELLATAPNLKGTHFTGEHDDDSEGDAGDLSTAAEAAEKGDEFLTEFESDAVVVGGTDDEGKKAEARSKTEAVKPAAEAPAGSVKPTAKGGRSPEGKMLTKTPGTIDEVFKARLNELVRMLMKMFKSNTLNMAAEAPGNRISSRHLARGELRYIHKRVYGGIGKRRYDIIFDCSGSMDGKPSREGKLLLLALNTLAKRGYLEGNLILTGWNGSAHCWAKYSFPVQDEVILRINVSCGAEGIQGTMKDNLAELKRSDDVYVYTDANITDDPLDRDFFARHGIQPVGLYVGSEEASPSMAEHFPQNIIDSSIERVVERMLCRNRR